MFQYQYKIRLVRQGFYNYQAVDKNFEDHGILTELISNICNNIFLLWI